MATKINDKTVTAAVEALREAGTIAEDANIATKKVAKIVAGEILGEEKVTPDHLASVLSYLQALAAEGGEDAEEMEDVEQSEEADEPEEKGGNSAVRPRYKALYKERETKTGCSDEMDIAFRALTSDKEKDELVEVLRKIATDNGVDMARFDKWCTIKNRDGSINVGMVRMNLSNVLRGIHKRGDKVVIGKQKFAADPEKQKERKAKEKAKQDRLKELQAKKAEKAASAKAQKEKGDAAKEAA